MTYMGKAKNDALHLFLFLEPFARKAGAESWQLSCDSGKCRWNTSLRRKVQRGRVLFHSCLENTYFRNALCSIELSNAEGGRRSLSPHFNSCVLLFGAVRAFSAGSDCDELWLEFFNLIHCSNNQGVLLLRSLPYVIRTELRHAKAFSFAASQHVYYSQQLCALHGFFSALGTLISFLFYTVQTLHGALTQ